MSLAPARDSHAIVYIEVDGFRETVRSAIAGCDVETCVGSIGAKLPENGVLAAAAPDDEDVQRLNPAPNLSRMSLSASLTCCVTWRASSAYECAAAFRSSF